MQNLNVVFSRFFVKAAIVARSSSDEKGAASTVSPWRLCTVSQVEELKMLLRLFPVWASERDLLQFGSLQLGH